MSGVTFSDSVRGRNIIAGNIFSGDASAHFHLSSASNVPDKSPHPSSSVIPFRRDPKFVPRGDLVEKITELCAKPAGRAALVGLGGVGKSQLAIEFAHRLKQESATAQEPTWIFWVHASTVPRIEQAFKEIAEIIKIPGRNQPHTNVTQLVCAKLSDETWGKWCMILDSCDDFDALFGTSSNAELDRPLATYLPQSENGSILVTTRNRNIAQRLTDDVEAIIQVGSMLQTEAIELLENRLGSSADPSQALALVQILDFLPLAINQAAAYIRIHEPVISLERYISEFRESDTQRQRLLEFDNGDLRRDGSASNAVLSTWQLSFESIHSKRPSAANLPSLMSFFNPQGIPEWILKQSINNPATSGKIDERLKDWKYGRRLSPIVSYLHNKMLRSRYQKSRQNSSLNPPSQTQESTDPHDESTARNIFADDILLLRDYSLITMTDGGNSFDMHGLIQFSTRRWLQVHSLQDVYKEQYVKLLSTNIPPVRFKNWKVWQEQFPHVQNAIEYCLDSNDFKEPWSIPLTTLLHEAAESCLNRGKFGLAESMLGLACMIRKERLGKKHQKTLQTMSRLATLYQWQGQYNDAEKLQARVLEVQKHTLGTRHLDTLESISNLATVYIRQDRYDDGIKLLEQALHIIKGSKEIEDFKTFYITHNLADTYRKKGRYGDAETLAGEALEIAKRLEGDNRTSALIAQRILAQIYLDQGHYEEAEKLLVEVLVHLVETIGATHPHTLTCMFDLSHNWKFMHRDEDALAMMKKCAQGFQDAFGSDHANTITALSLVDKWK